MATIRIVGVQMQVSSKLEENLPKILKHIKLCDADYILFPEMSLTGYHGEFSQRTTEAAWGQIAAQCRQRYVTALIGTGSRDEDATHIQTRIYSHQGELLGTHEKLVPTSGDRKFCRPGEELRAFRHHGLVFGCLICNDLWVTPGCGPYPDPRLAFQLGKKGAQIIFHSVNSGTDAKAMAYHESNLAMRARESGLFIATANAASPDGPVNCTSGIMSPEGEWLVTVPRTGEYTYSYDIDVEIDVDEDLETQAAVI
jgi:predicted amidohydrolase